MSEVIDLASELIGVDSPSRHEEEIADTVEQYVRTIPHLEVTRVGNNVIARTHLGKSQRVVMAGHLDTVPVGIAHPTIKDGELWGLGAADMKGTLAAMLVVARRLEEPAVDLSWVFYAREEIARSESGLREIASHDAELLQGDVAILGEPTNGSVEAGCQGTMHLTASFRGVAAHTARPFMGVNAIHRLNDILPSLVDASPRSVEIDGVTFVEQIQVVGMRGGSAGNVIPDEAVLQINHRFAPDRSASEAEAWVRSLVKGHLDERYGDDLKVDDVAEGALPNLKHPLLQRLVELSDKPVSAKVGWTDVATFAALGVPAANFGAGDPMLAHHADERVPVVALDEVARVFTLLLGG